VKAVSGFLLFEMQYKGSFHWGPGFSQAKKTAGKAGRLGERKLHDWRSESGKNPQRFIAGDRQRVDYARKGPEAVARLNLVSAGIIFDFAFPGDHIEKLGAVGMAVGQDFKAGNNGDLGVVNQAVSIIFAEKGLQKDTGIGMGTVGGI
jgi:hypothetical protein